ncbi:hypothetical protein Glove_52g123 [Diversispora epigaea]|uniref:Uncharacterized protein n=1 Tax=Diversispora epigaea TaxID=1348612 RepID=A0A397JPC1_9GLOM|nr:hypothetical protein Glove_52g123 [Diversispora epigaea]
MYQEIKFIMYCIDLCENIFLSRQAAKEQGYFLNILRGSKKGKGSTSPYPKVSPKTPFRKISRQMTPKEFGSVQQSENLTRRRPLFRDIMEEIARLSTPQVIIEEGGNGTENGGNRTEEDRNRTEESVTGTHEASSIHRETGASQEIVSRKRRREDDDEVASHIGYKEFPDYFEDWDQKRWSFYYDIKINSKLKAKHCHRRGTIADKIRKTIFMTFGESNLPKITTKSLADVIKNWKECWTSRPSEEQLAFIISVIKYIFNPNIYSIQIKDEEKMNANEKIQFLEKEFNEKEEEGEEEDEEGEEEKKEEKEITQEVIEEIKESGEDEEEEVLTTGFAIQDNRINPNFDQTEKMNANEKIQFLEKEFNEKEEEGEEEDEEGEEEKKEEKEITQEVIEEIKESGEDEEEEVLTTGFAIRQSFQFIII